MIAEPALVDAPSAIETPNPPVAAAFQFHGDAREYFRIWIVNTLLTLLTLGLFSAWAKVRKRRYLRGNTELLGHRFDYTADPKRILVVTAKGDVAAAKVVKATDPLFGKAAVKAVSSWKFLPGNARGKAVKTLMQQPISFSLEPDADVKQQSINTR